MQVTTRNSALSFTAQCWVENGGAAIADDAAPTNLASVAAGRRFSNPAGILLTSAANLMAFAVGGTSAIIRFWWYDSVMDLWVPNGANATITSATTNSAASLVGSMPGSQFYMQMVTNTGVTKVAFFLR